MSGKLVRGVSRGAAEPAEVMDRAVLPRSGRILTLPIEGWGECPHEPVVACRRPEPENSRLWGGSTESRPIRFEDGAKLRRVSV